jgi:hypothetical protein
MDREELSIKDLRCLRRITWTSMAVLSTLTLE